AQGARVLDVRPTADFGGGHIPGAIGVPLDGSQFQNRVGLVVPAAVPLMLVAGDEASAKRAATALGVIGYTNLAGFLAGGIDAWRAAGEAVEEIPSISVQELGTTLARDGAAMQVIDVREPGEWESGHIPEAVHIPFYH